MAKLIYRKHKVPEAGRWLCSLVRVEEEANKYYNPETDRPDRAKSLGWVFSHDHNPESEIRIWSSPSLSVFKGTKSKALQLVEALTDKQMTDQDKEDFDGTDSLVGRKCYLTVEHITRPDGSVYARSDKYESESGKQF